MMSYNNTTACMLAIWSSSTVTLALDYQLCVLSSTSGRRNPTTSSKCTWTPFPCCVLLVRYLCIAELGQHTSLIESAPVWSEQFKLWLSSKLSGPIQGASGGGTRVTSRQKARVTLDPSLEGAQKIATPPITMSTYCLCCLGPWLRIRLKTAWTVTFHPVVPLHHSL